MAGIDRLAEVMGWDGDFDQVSKDRLCEEAASEILRLRAALSNARAEERERCAKIAETHYDLRHGTLAYIHGTNIAIAIRKQKDAADDTIENG